ncbi:hypothetical protein R1flu_024368 [Riccia fluitans]|uniref:Uncharacterized protein n=1 Tax=Riccia fluitans TaxID=41844 RepID=A0ABD1XXL6_9MARC
MGDYYLQRQRKKEDEDEENRISFVLNGKLVTVEDADPRMSLGDYLRNEQGLKGLKLFCRQGGCGSCTVLLSSPEFGNAAENAPVHRTINSCLRPLCSVDGMVVTTVEAVGNTKTGLHPIQEQLVKTNGTQCGFCTPGMVMTMYGLLQENPKPSQQEVENAIDGNLCRCTGYRPILDAFQTFSCASPLRTGVCQGQSGGAGCADQISGDIEDCVPQKRGVCGGELTRLTCSKDRKTWVRATSLSELYMLLRNGRCNGGVRMVRGNTSTGIYDPPEAKLLIDISRIPELSKISVTGDKIIIGGAATITDLMLVLKSNLDRSPTFQPLLKHLQKVAHPHVRNIGSVAGNLVLCNNHGDFPSDIATILTAAGVRLRLAMADTFGTEENVGLWEFFQINLQGVVVLEIQLPYAPAQTQFKSYKVALRNANALPVLNAAFKFELEKSTGNCINSPVIVYGGVKQHPIRAYKTEAFLEGKCCYNMQVLNQAYSILSSEMVVDPELGRKEYKSTLLGSFFFKAMLSLRPAGSIPPRLRLAVENDERPISKGQVSYDEGDPALYPVSKPYSKSSAALQVAGEAVYLDDVNFAGELHAALVTATVSSGKIKKIDATRALAEKGVISFFSAASIANDGYCNLASEDEEVFASNQVIFYGQALGLIVATSKEIADAAAKLVDITYTDQKPPVLTIEDAIAANSFFDERGVDFTAGSAEDSFKVADVIVEGQVSIGHQWHFHLETQRAVCVPGEDQSITVYSSSQNPAQVHQCVSVGLNKPQHKVEVIVKRVGGAFGSKLNRPAPIAMACSYAADKLQKPVRLVLDLETNMQTVGGRSPYLCKYKVGARKDGIIKAVQLQLYNNTGAHFDYEYPNMEDLVTWLDSCYNIPNWTLQGKVCKTNLPGMTYMRGPGFVEMLFMLETAIEHTADILSIRPDIVREMNMYVDGDRTLQDQLLPTCNVKLIFDTLKTSSDFEQRTLDIERFNSSNQWVKRGMSMVPCKFVALYEAQTHTALVNVYPDGSIGIHGSGCEVGQGLDIKIAQVAALVLGKLSRDGINPHDVRVNPTTTVVANNTLSTGGSVTSELAAAVVQDACLQIAERLQVIADTLQKHKSQQPTWQELIDEAVTQVVDLQARGGFLPAQDVTDHTSKIKYLAFGAGVTEAEVDCLTGEVKIVRCDLTLDCGKSLNPAVDIGQVQGAYVQGLGYFLHEEFLFDHDSGKLLTNSTWEYKPPSSKDIPLDFRASLLQNSDNPMGIFTIQVFWRATIWSSSKFGFGGKTSYSSCKNRVRSQRMV